MATTDEKVASISTGNTQKTTLARQFSGATFLTLEHVGYFVLVVLMPALLTVGALMALGLWTHSNDDVIISITSLIGPQFTSPDTAGATFLVATLLILAPLMYCLRQRVAAEYVKRPGYVGRVGYKLPIYSALAVLVTLKVAMVVSMLYVFLSSLTSIGVRGADIGDMYLNQFLPALLGAVVFGSSAWYVLWFAKGKDMSRRFVGVVTVLSAAMIVALFVTIITVNHNPRDDSRGTNPPVQIQPYSPQNSTYDF